MATSAKSGFGMQCCTTLQTEAPTAFHCCKISTRVVEKLQSALSPWFPPDEQNTWLGIFRIHMLKTSPYVHAHTYGVIFTCYYTRSTRAYRDSEKSRQRQAVSRCPLYILWCIHGTGNGQNMVEVSQRLLAYWLGHYSCYAWMQFYVNCQFSQTTSWLQPVSWLCGHHAIGKKFDWIFGIIGHFYVHVPLQQDGYVPRGPSLYSFA